MCDRLWPVGLLIATLVSLYAQTQRFDQFPFAPPAGYSLAEQKAEVMAYAKIDAQKRFYCQILVYRAQPTTGAPEGDFQKEWKEAVEVSFRPKAKPAGSAFAFPNAAHSYFGLSATTDSNGRPALTSLWVVRFPARYVGVVFNGPSEEAVVACSGDAVNGRRRVTPAVGGGRLRRRGGGWRRGTSFSPPL